MSMRTERAPSAIVSGQILEAFVAEGGEEVFVEQVEGAFGALAGGD